VVYNTQITRGFCFVHRPEFENLDNVAFRKLDLFPSSGNGKKTPALLGLLEREEKVSSF
jgi:hypothetical protein